jgi:hypothetical protein
MSADAEIDPRVSNRNNCTRLSGRRLSIILNGCKAEKESDWMKLGRTKNAQRHRQISLSIRSGDNP